MNKRPSNDLEYRAELRRLARLGGAPIENDSVIDVKHDNAGRPMVDSIKTVYRPEEAFSKPVKPYWKYIWLAIIILAVVAWFFLFSYYSTHQAPSAAPISGDSASY